MEKLKGKKLLILAAGADHVSLIKRAQDYGVYVIVTDMYKDHQISPGKDVANEYWDISWKDIDALEKKCIEEKIDGVCAGYSEFTVESQILLCERLGLPCYLTMEQLNITRDKVKFKNTCREYGVPVVKEYTSIEEVDEFPVIVKPVDRAGSIGISIATDKKSLIESFNYAMELSVCKEVIIEKYITGTKIDLYYEIIDGEVTLVASSDTINAKNNGYNKVIQSAWLFPSKYQDFLVEKADAAIKRMIKGIGIINGYIFLSGFVQNREISFFEAGFRLCGGHLYKYLEKKGLVNNLDLFISHALTGKVTLQPAECINENLKCANLNFYAKKGVVGEVKGREAIREIADNEIDIVWVRKGQKCDDSQAILSKLAMFYFCNESAEVLQNDCRRAYQLFEVMDVYGNDMIYDRIDDNLIKSWWG